MYGALNTAVHKSREPGSPATKFLTVSPDISGASACKYLNVTLLAPRILGHPPGFWKICVPLFQHMQITCHVYSWLHTVGFRYFSRFKTSHLTRPSICVYALPHSLTLYTSNQIKIKDKVEGEVGGVQIS